jgi:(heptosyl)LPS beta-1,4-glucosyltransferase
MASKISVVINTLNEASSLPRVISSVRALAGEIVVCDMESDDNTREVAKKLGAEVFTHKRLSYVEPARNFAVSKATGDWILILDPDEEVPSGLAKKIKEIVKNPQAGYYRIPRKNIIFGKWIKHTRWWPDYNIRLFKKGMVSWNEVIHAVPMTQGLGADIPVKEGYALIHHNYEDIDQFIERMNRYTKIQSGELMKNGYVFAWQDLIAKPMSEFLSRYFAGEGYKDGVHGLALSLLQALSEFTLYSKVWQKQGFKDTEIKKKEINSELDRVILDLKWWMRKKFSFWGRFF